MKTYLKPQMLTKVYFVSICFVLIFSETLLSQSPTFSWARQLNGTGEDVGNDVAVGSSTGSIYTTGGFSGLADFDKNFGGWYLSSAGNRDIFISKTDASGNMLWLKKIGGVNDDYGIHICVDNLENVYVSGRFSGTVDFDPGAGVSNLTSATQVSFILKLTGAGNFAYAYVYGGAVTSIQIADIQTDASNNLIAAGQLNGTWDFDPQAGISNLSAYQVGYILKLSAAGAFVFAKQLAASSPNYNGITAMCLDGSGNIVVSGNINGSADFDPGLGIVTLTSSSTTFANDYFVAKYSSAGAYVWAGLTGGTLTTNIFSEHCTTDAAGNIYISSRSFGGNVDFDISGGTNNLLTTSGSKWVQKIKSNGTFAWAKNFGALNLAIDDIKTNATNGLYLTGTFYNSSLDADPGPAVFSIPNTSSTSFYDDIFIIKLDTAFNFQWAKGFGASYNDISNGLFITTADNVITIGSYIGAGDFDPNAGVATLLSKGASDIYIQKLNSTGLFTWVYGVGSETAVSVNAVSRNVSTSFCAAGSLSANPSSGNLIHHGGMDIFVARGTVGGSLGFSFCMGGAGIDAGTGIISDASDNIYLTGYFEQTADFAPSRFKPSFPLTSAGLKDIFILKINVSGNLVWAKRIGSTSNDEAAAITIDNTGNLFVTGIFQGTVDFDPGAGITNLASAGNTDVFVLKMDTAGNFIWAKNVGGTSSDIGSAITVDASGNAVVTGSFYATVDFDPSGAVANLTSLGNGDCFVLKLNSAGNFVWAKQAGSAGGESGRCITTDGSNIFIGGTFGGATDFDPGAGNFTITPPNGNPEIFIQKLDASGNFVFAKSMGGTSHDVVSGIALDAAGNIYTTGSFNGTADLNPHATNVTNFTSNGGSDVFINCYNSILDTSWTKTFGGLQSDGVAGIAIDGAFSIYAVGNFGEIVDFNPDAGIYNLTAPGDNGDVFALKLSQSSPLPIELLEFTATLMDNGQVLCKWTTATELNNDFFTVERSADGDEFEEVKKVTGSNTSNILKHYSAIDAQPLHGLSYYRLKQTDVNGSYTYSKTVSVSIAEKMDVTAYPNPAVSSVKVEFESDQNQTAIISLADYTGKIILSENVDVTKGIASHQLNLNSIPAGIYLITLKTQRSQSNIKVIKK